MSKIELILCSCCKDISQDSEALVGCDSDIQEYYEVTLLDDQKTLTQKTVETNQVASRWDRPSTTTNSVIHPPQVVDRFFRALQVKG